jgi:hypothetical protein
VHADPLDKWVCVLTIDNVLSIFSFSSLEYKKNISLGLKLSKTNLNKFTREEFQVHVSPDAQTLIVPNMEDTPIGTAFGVNTNNFEVSFLIGFSRAEITCMKYLPYVFQEVKETPKIVEISDSESNNDPMESISK